MRRIATLAAISTGLISIVAGAPGASAEMRSKKLGNNLCKTTGGGDFVRIPHSGGERIDKRLLPDVRWMQRKFNIGVGDGYATSGHSPNGEHPIGAALDIFSGNGRSSGWDKIDRLAKIAEPRPNRPKLPWRWVGYDGDAGHGRGHHLHLSWAHSDNTTFGKPARWVLTRICPGKGGGDGAEGGGISAGKTSFRNLAPAVPEPGS